MPHRRCAFSTAARETGQRCRADEPAGHRRCAGGWRRVEGGFFRCHHPCGRRITRLFASDCDLLSGANALESRVCPFLPSLSRPAGSLRDAARLPHGDVARAQQLRRAVPHFHLQLGVVTEGGQAVRGKALPQHARSLVPSHARQQSLP